MVAAKTGNPRMFTDVMNEIAIATREKKAAEAQMADARRRGDRRASEDAEKKIKNAEAKARRAEGTENPIMLEAGNDEAMGPFESYKNPGENIGTTNLLKFNYTTCMMIVFAILFLAFVLAQGKNA